MSRSPDPCRAEKLRRILELLSTMPSEVVERLLDEWMWELDHIWRIQGIPEDLEERIHKGKQRSDETNASIDETT